MLGGARPRGGLATTRSPWLRRGVLGGVALLMLGYLAWCCTVLTSRSSEGLRAVVPRFLRSPTEAEEKAAVRAELGRGTWNMLHRMAAQFDKVASPARQAEVAEFFRLLGEFYPCEQCAAHFRGMLAERPIRAGGNRELSLWLCELHNVVNERLRKPQFPCTLEALKERWGKCGCFDPPPNGTEAAGVEAAPAPAAAVLGRLRR